MDDEKTLKIQIDLEGSEQSNAKVKSISEQIKNSKIVIEECGEASKEAGKETVQAMDSGGKAAIGFAEKMRLAKIAAKELREQQTLQKEMGVISVSADEIEKIKGGAEDSRVGLGKLDDGLKLNKHETEEAGLSHHELRKVLTHIGNVVAPGCGRALAELALGPVGAALALVAVYEKVKEKIEEIDKAWEELSSKELESHTQAVEKWKQAWADAAVAAAAYNTAMSTAAMDKDPAGTELKNLQTITAARNKAHDERMEQLKKEEIAYLKAHGASPEQIAQVEESQRISREENKHKEGQVSNQQIEADIENRRKDQPNLDATARAATDKVRAAQQALDKSEKEKKDAEEAAATAKKIEEKYNKQTEVVYHPWRDPLGFVGSGFDFFSGRTDAEIAEYRRAKKEAEGQKDAEQRAVDAKIELDNANAEKSEADRIAQENLEKSGKSGIPGQEGSEARELAAKKNLQKTETEEEQKQRLLNSQPFRIYDQQTGQLSGTLQLEKLLAATGKTHAQQEAILNQIVDGQETFVNVVIKLAHQFDQQQQQIRQLQSTGFH